MPGTVTVVLHLVGDEASRGLAASLQMRQYGVDAHVSGAI